MFITIQMFKPLIRSCLVPKLFQCMLICLYFKCYIIASCDNYFLPNKGPLEPILQSASTPSKFLLQAKFFHDRLILDIHLTSNYKYWRVSLFSDEESYFNEADDDEETVPLNDPKFTGEGIARGLPLVDYDDEELPSPRGNPKFLWCKIYTVRPNLEESFLHVWIIFDCNTIIINTIGDAKLMLEDWSLIPWRLLLRALIQQVSVECQNRRQFLHKNLKTFYLEKLALWLCQ